MPEQSPEAGRDLVGALVRDEQAHDLAPDAFTVRAAAIESGPLADGKSAKKRLGIGAWLAIAWLVVIFGSAILAPVLPIDRADVANPAVARQAPSRRPPLGVDANGHDMVSRIVWGARNSLFIAVVSVAFGFLARRASSACSPGTSGGRSEAVLGSVTDILLAFPQLVLALSIVTFLGHTVFNVTDRARDRLDAGARADRRARRPSAGPSASS